MLSLNKLFKNKNLKSLIPTNQINYPIYSEDENILTSINGDKTYSYELIAKDLNQLDPTGANREYFELGEFLNALSEDEWLKVYRWNTDKIYVSTNIENLKIAGVQTLPLNASIATFFGEVDPYSDINFYENYLTINSEYWKLVHLDVPPSEFYESFLDDLNVDYMVSFKKIGTKKAKRDLLLKRRAQGVSLNTLHQNHEGEASYFEADNLLRAVTTEGEGLFSVSVWIIIKAEKIEKINDKTYQVVKLLRDKGAKPFVESTGLDFFFTYLLMGVRPTFMKSFTTGAAYLSNLLPYSRDYLHDQGVLLHAQNGSDLYLDLYAPYSTNQNWLITGASGEGKSFFACVLMHDLYFQGAKIGVFDLGGSLRKMALYLGGVDLTRHFNPMQFKNPNYLLRFILSVVSNDKGFPEFSAKKTQGKLYQLIEQALLEGISNFKNLILFIGKEIEGIEYYFSELWEYFTDEDIIAPDIFYLDTEDKPESLIAPYLIFAKELNDSREGKTVNFYDECWDIFEKCPDIIRSSAKTGRKHLIGNIFLTQEIVELSSSHGDVASAVIGNTYAKIYFHQPNLEHPILSDFEKEKIKEVKSKKGIYSEFFFSSPDNKKICRFFVSPLFFELSNSEKIHTKNQQDYISQYEGILSYKDAMNKWVKFLYE